MVGIVFFQGLLAYPVIGDLGMPDWDYRPVADVYGESPYAKYPPPPHPQHVLGPQGEEAYPLQVMPMQGANEKSDRTGHHPRRGDRRLPPADVLRQLLPLRAHARNPGREAARGADPGHARRGRTGAGRRGRPPRDTGRRAAVAVRAGDEKAVARGRAVYFTFCAQCHGPNFDGNGTVGQSFVPPPTDLRSAKVQAAPSGELFKSVSYGIPGGRQPALDTTIGVNDRWSVIAFVQSLGARR